MPTDPHHSSFMPQASAVSDVSVWSQRGVCQAIQELSAKLPGTRGWPWDAVGGIKGAWLITENEQNRSTCQVFGLQLLTHNQVRWATEATNVYQCWMAALPRCRVCPHMPVLCCFWFIPALDISRSGGRQSQDFAIRTLCIPHIKMLVPTTSISRPVYVMVLPFSSVCVRLCVRSFLHPNGARIRRNPSRKTPTYTVYGSGHRPHPVSGCNERPPPVTRRFERSDLGRSTRLTRWVCLCPRQSCVCKVLSYGLDLRVL